MVEKTRTKQEEIRDGIGRIIGGLFGEDWDKLPDVKPRNHYLYTDKQQYLKAADDFLNYLDSKDVAIKVKRELPFVTSTYTPSAHGVYVRIEKEALSEQGYEAVESLVGD